ncbi:nucleotide sugar dehydrogenase [Bacteroidia bacterium]|nr:nucleotide sugar dehydrogenase [Bacteroidia bacterium]
MKTQENKIAILGLGYVGLPLAIEFSRIFETIGHDIDEEKVKNLEKGRDTTRSIQTDELVRALSKNLSLTNENSAIADCNIYIITVPTDINEDKTPNLSPLIRASQMVGEVLKEGDLVIYESTTYPGCTEEVCVPVLEGTSGLLFNEDFTIGYSPERINPGDPKRNLKNIIKVTAGSTPATAERVDELYNQIVQAGTFKASSIKVAEASKAIENAQRDLNISFVNELAIIFDKLDIDTSEVLEAAQTKWNFLPFKPGLVGGHCIGVDPYYLAHKAQALGHHPQVILSGRKINDNMALFVASNVVKLMSQKAIPVKKSNILIMGFAFKENSSDFRNTKIWDLYKELIDFGAAVNVYDPLVDDQRVKKQYSLDLIKECSISDYQVVILAVPHDAFLKMKIHTTPNSVVYDLKGVLPKSHSDKRL